jgi:cytochrome c peroxidase
MSDETLPTGQKAFGKYRAFATLGSGGMGDVFLAIARGRRGVNKLVVIKSLKRDFAREQAYVDMFLDEARLAARLNHPNVVHIFEVDEADGEYFIAMEFLEGQSLKQVLDHVKAHGVPFEPTVAVRLVSDALAGLHYAHELADYDGRPLQIIHRDISPHNIFVTYDGQVKVVDFGIAKSASRSSDATQSGVLKGKLAYMSLEQALGEPIDRRADIYAMGIVLWEALTLTSMSQGESGPSALTRILKETMPRVSSVLPNIDPELDDLVAKALEKEPAKRFQTAAEMRGALETWITHTTKVVRQEEVGQRISAMFKDVRAELDRKVKDQMAAAVAASQLDDLAPASNVSSRGPNSGTLVAGGPSPQDAAIEASPPTLAAGSGMGTGSGIGVGVTVKTAPSRRLRGATLAAAAVVGLVAGVGIWQYTRGASASQAAAAAASVAPAAESAASAEIDEGRLESFGPLPDVVSSPQNPLSEEKISLGRMLFYDARLSKNQDVSCNTCHLLDAYGVDGKKVSTGHAQQTGTRNAPTVYNSAGFFALMWDGRFPNVEEQAKGPLTKDVEMNTTPKRVEETLSSMPEYVAMFAKAFPGERSPVTFDNTARAIGAFERKLFTPGRWEKFLAGEKAALTPAEKVGFNTFVETGCPTCHFGPYVGASMFQKLGLVKAWPSSRDRGKFELTQKNEDYMVFRVPSLRNVAKTGPYLHDGSMTSLPEVVRMMARHQVGKELTDAQANAIVAWLGCLTGDLPADYIKKPELPPSTKKTPHAEL